MKKILVIEDEQPVRANILKLLEAEGFEVIGAENGTIGVQLAAQHLPDLILCDIMMTELDGFGVLTALRQNPITALIPFIFLTARSDRTDFRLGMELGADDYLTKPFTRSELLKAVTSRLGKYTSVNQLLQQIQTLTEQNLLKDDLIDTVTHDLRAPLANMQMILRVLPTLTTETQRQQYMQLLQAECARELNLVNDLLELQRIETNKTTFAAELIEVQTLTSEVAEPFQSRLKERQQNFTIHVAPNLPKLHSNSEGLMRVLSELLNNACKYTAPGGEIIFSIGYEQSSEIASAASFVFCISNQAEIPEDELPRIFDKFYRVPKSDRWKQGGTGLGLTLAKKLVEHLGGQIAVTSKDGWTKFVVQLPDRSMPELNH